MYEFYPIDDEYTMSISSAKECTGLIPAGTTDEDELEYYEELYPYSPSEIME